MQTDDVGQRCRFIYSPGRWSLRFGRAAGEGRGTRALESIQRTAFGFLHLTRSPRHGMLGSARRRAFWDAWETTACPGYWCEERLWFPFSLLWMAALTSQQIGTTGRTNNKARAKSTLFCCRAPLISFWYLLWLQSVSTSRGEWLGFKNKGSLWGW